MQAGRFRKIALVGLTSEYAAGGVIVRFSPCSVFSKIGVKLFSFFHVLNFITRFAVPFMITSKRAP
jgi:hypothetical protein